MKAILMSIQPKWCELIASGKKTVEVRKTKPKLETPFKVYIYCTQGSDLLASVNGNVQKPNTIKLDLKTDNEIQELNGKVIGEFVCEDITDIHYHEAADGYSVAMSHPLCDFFAESTCLKYEEIHKYLHGNNGYGWHISDLVIYDKPRKLSGFFHYCGDDPKCDGCEAHYFSNTECGKEDYCCSPMDGCKPLKRPPQSWCYVEEVNR